MDVVDADLGAFPASAATPGQQESRSAYRRFVDKLREYLWADDYLELREQGLDWRKAVYVAWASLPAVKRQPPTQRDLAVEVLGLRGAHTISKWKRKFPELDDLIAERQAAPLLKYRADVFEALGQTASMVDPRAATDRKLFLTLTGDYRERVAVGVSGNEEGEPVEVAFDVSGLPDEVLRLISDSGADSRVADSGAERAGAPGTD